MMSDLKKEATIYPFPMQIEEELLVSPFSPQQLVMKFVYKKFNSVLAYLLSV